MRPVAKSRTWAGANRDHALDAPPDLRTLHNGGHLDGFARARVAAMYWSCAPALHPRHPSSTCASTTAKGYGLQHVQ